ncbi:MAG: SDR family NAD(P)-dependent oxidoreductase [Oscillospiraceae bacterium]|nr:SDR family NAD(P)-dependent oxidoreductase [Oscillospiraceae bacterium]
MKKTIFVLGAGNGCGNRVAEKFGRNDFRVVLMARNAAHLAAYEAEFKEKGIDVYTQVADASKPHSVTKAFADLKAKFGTPDVLFYNVGVTSPDTGINGEKDVDLLVERYKVDVAGAYHAIQQVLGEEFSQKQGTILVTGGGLAMYPMYDYLPLSMDKAALRAMCLALHEELKKLNVYLGTLTVTGTIAPGERCDPVLLAEDFWKLYTERKDCEIVH